MEFEQLLYELKTVTIYAYRLSWEKEDYICINRHKDHINVRTRESLEVLPKYVIENQKPEPLIISHIKVRSLPFFDKITKHTIERGWTPNMEDMLSNDWEII